MRPSFFQELLSGIVEQGRRLALGEEGLPPGKRDLIALSDAILSGRGEASGTALAAVIVESFRHAGEEQRSAFFRALAERFGPDHERIGEAAARYGAEPSNANAAALHHAAEPSRQELFRRINLAPGGTAALVAMREDLLGRLRAEAGLDEVDRDFHHLLSSWFNRGFLVLERIDWATPAVILEKIIRHEAVHAIQSWDDLRRRIEPADRRCFAFFHPALIDEPLIFVEVALTRGIPEAIAPILAEDRAVLSGDKADTAVFYSISNCQEGLRGVSFGNFLIKQVVEELKRDLPRLETFVTLSPVPTFRRWLAGLSANDPDGLLDARRCEAIEQLDQEDWHEDGAWRETARDRLMPLAAFYFLHAKRPDGGPYDPVARFHLGNGARLERLDWLGDLSDRGLKQSAGLMVNYLYDLRHIEANHEAFANQRQVVASSAVKRALKDQPATRA